MVSLADFVVVTEDAYAINYVGQSVFELMNRTGNRLRNLPEREFGEGYFHGHSVGGTNPSLLEARGCGNAIIAHDYPFNREVAGEAAAPKQAADELREI